MMLCVTLFFMFYAVLFGTFWGKAVCTVSAVHAVCRVHCYHELPVVIATGVLNVIKAQRERPVIVRCERKRLIRKKFA